MANIDKAQAQLEKGLFDTDSDESHHSSGSDKTPLSHLKPVLKEGDRIVAAWWDLNRNEKINTPNNEEWFEGVINRVREKDHYAGSYASRYGPVRVYDIHYDDGDKLKGILDVFVCDARDYDLENNGRSERNWKGVRHVKDGSSSDRYAKEIGWYVATIGRKEKSFALLYDAMKASDEYIIRKMKGNVRKSDLNLPKEWDLSKKRGRPEPEVSEDVKPSKKSKKNPIFDDSDEDSEDAMEDENGSTEIPNYIGAIQVGKTYLSKFYYGGKEKNAGSYLLKSDAAHARDECCREVREVGSSGRGFKGFNFKTIEEYKTARSREIATRGLSMEEAGTLSEVTAKIQEERNQWKWSDDDIDENGSGSHDIAPEIPEQEQDEIASKADSELSAREEKKKYIGAYYVTSVEKYRGNVHYNNRGYSVGDYVLEADAAHARDELCRTVRITDRGINFSTKEEYETARAMEIERRGLNLDEARTSSEIVARIQAKKESWSKKFEIPEEADESSEEDYSVASEQDEIASKADSKPSAREEKKKYTGAYYVTSVEKYRGKLYYNNHGYLVGDYVLEADAAYARDELCRTVRIKDRGINFSTKEEYETARLMEIERRGLNLDKEKTLSDVLARIRAKKASWSKMFEIPEEADESSEEDYSVASEKDEIASKADSKPSASEEKKKYTGVYYITNTEKYRGTLHHNNNIYSAGEYVLEADAAHARDELCRILGITDKGISFSTKEEFADARTIELERRGLSVDEAKTSSEILARIQAKKVEWCKKFTTSDEADESSQSSSDDIPLIDFKSNRRLTPPMDSVKKSRSRDYRGVSHNQRKEKHWTVSIFYNNQDRCVGVYDLESDAARVYDEIAAILLSSNEKPNFATKADYEEARRKEIATLGVNLDAIDPFDVSMEKAQIYLNSLLSDSVVGQVSRLRRPTSPFKPITLEEDSEASSLENEEDSSRKQLSDLNEAMSTKWGMRLPAAESVFLESYQQNICEMLGGFGSYNSNGASTGGLVSTSTVESLGYHNDQDKDLDVDESTDNPPRNIYTLDSGINSPDYQVQQSHNDDILEDENSDDNQNDPVEAAGHNNQCDVPAERNNSIQSHEISRDSQDEIMTEKPKEIETPSNIVETNLNVDGKGVAKKKNQHGEEVGLVQPGHDNKNEFMVGEHNVEERHENEEPHDGKNDHVVKKKKSDEQKEEDSSNNNTRERKRKYIGISVSSKQGKPNRYRGRVQVSGEMKHTGDFLLAADAAHCRDVCCRCFGLVTRPLNFATLDDYERARTAEIIERGLTLNVAGKQSVVARIDARKRKWDAESKKPNPESTELADKMTPSKQSTQEEDSEDDMSLFSDTGNEAEKIERSKDNSVATFNVSNVAATKSTSKPADMNLIEMTREQEEGLEFPIGCRVLWQLQDESFQRGVVSSGFFNMNPPVQLVYEVMPLHGESKQIKFSHELAFDTHSPVYLKTTTDKSSPDEGEVLLSKNIADEKTLYTILIKKEGNQFHLKYDVPSDQVSLKKTAESSASSPEQSANLSDLHAEQEPHAKTMLPKETTPKILKSPGENCDMSISTSNSTISTRDSGQLSTPRGRIGNAAHWDKRSIDIVLPHWFVSDNEIKDHLGCKFYYSRLSLHLFYFIL